MDLYLSYHPLYRVSDLLGQHPIHKWIQQWGQKGVQNRKYYMNGPGELLECPAGHYCGGHCKVKYTDYDKVGATSTEGFGGGAEGASFHHCAENEEIGNYDQKYVRSSEQKEAHQAEDVAGGVVAA